MKVTSPSQCKLARVLGFLFFILIFSSRSTLAQYGATPLALAPGSPVGSYKLSDIDTVNLFNGHVNVRMPVLTAQGRGGAKGQITFNWESPASFHIRTDVDPNNGAPLNYVEPGGGAASTIDGLTLGFAQVYGVQSGTQTSYYCSLDGTYTYQKTLTRLYFVEPDGTEHEMRDVQTGGQALPISICQMNGPSRGKVFVSTDGSGATFIADSPVIDYTYAGGDFPIIGPTGYLMLSDGTRYRMNDPLQMRDRNGNLLSLTYVNNPPVFQYQITDSLNRQTFQQFGVACPPPTSGTCQKLSYKGFNGSSRGIYLTNGSPIRLILPNGLDYKFYLNEYGDLTRIDLPTGGSIEYTYGAGIDGPQPDPYAWIQGLQNSMDGTYPLGLGVGVVYRRVTERRVYKEGHVLESRQTFSKPEYFDGSGNINPINLGYVDQKQYDASGNLLNTERHFFYGAATNSFYVGPTDYSSWKEGREYHSEFYDQNGSLLRQTNLTWEQRTAVPWWGGSVDASPQMDPRLSQVTTVLENGQSSTTTNGYDATVPYNSLTDVYQYDYSGALLRHTQTTFVKTLNGTDYTGTNIQDPALPYMRELPAQVSVFDGSGEQSRTSFEYDIYTATTNHAALVARSAISGLDASFSTSYIYRGNATGVTRYLLTGGVVTGSVSTYAQYDVAGNIVKNIDARGNTSTIGYSDVYGSNDGEAHTNHAPSELSSVGQSSFAFPTSTTNALNQTTYTKFDYYLGRAVDVEDVNGIVSSAAFNDSLDRPTQIVHGANQSTSIESQTSYSYDDTNRVVTTTSDQSSYNDANPLKTQTVYDSLGRIIENRQYEGGSNFISRQVQYDDLGRQKKQSNPFRQSETAVWTTTTYDALGRVVSVTTPDNAAVATAYSGNTSTTTDQAGKQRKLTKDALGRITQVNEAPNDPSYNYQTTYGYDGLDNVTAVYQGSQTRTFVYDSLSQLKTATFPESGTLTYNYDNNGNLTSKTDGRNITTTQNYDVLNRLTSTSYNDIPQTATVNYFYDAQSLPSGAPSFDRGAATGRLVAVTYGAGSSAGTYRGYDALGRVVRQYQQTDAVNYLVEATYNQASYMITETYPSVPGAGDRRTVIYVPDAAGRVGSLSTSATSYAPAASVSGIGYASHNGIATESFGNSLVHAVTYNNRLQPTQIKLGTTGTPTSAVSIIYDYGTTNNNGNLLSVSYAGGGLSYTQTFGYDAVNRLTTSQEGASWSQTNSYDRYGNRSVGGNLSYSASSNHITNSGYAYDASGNLTNDTVHSYSFDAANRIIKVDNTLAYVYDGEGRRVRKLVNENLRFIYGIDGQQIAEFNGSTGALQKEYIDGAEGVVASIEPTAVNANGTRYLTSDHLGSPRVVTNSSAAVVSRHDYRPFGDELLAGTGGRSAGQGYAPEGLRQQFAGKERDNETGLDFSKARYYASIQGRFTSADPVLINANRLADPQQINLYNYARNNPLRFTDPTGEDIDDSSLDNNEYYQRWKKAFLATKSGQAQWNRLANDHSITVTITMGDNSAGGQYGAETIPTFDANGKATGASIVLGSKFGQKAVSPSDYPIGSTMTSWDPNGGYSVSSEARAIGILAHEFGHVEDAQKLGGVEWQKQNDIINEMNAGFKREGSAYWQSADYQKLLTQCGCKNVSDIKVDRELRAEGYMIPVLRDYFAKGAGHGSMPGRVKQAIKDYEKAHP